MIARAIPPGFEISETGTLPDEAIAALAALLIEASEDEEEANR